MDKSNSKQHIVISYELKEELDKLVLNKKDTYEDIIKRLLKNVQQK